MADSAAFSDHKAAFLRAVDGHAKLFKNEIQRVKSLLNDAVKEKTNHDNVRNWISQLRDGAEDVVQTFVSRVADNPWSRSRIGTLSPYPHHLHRSIRSGLLGKVMGKRLKAVELHYGFNPLREDEDEVGLEEDVEMLLQKAILEESQGLSIACIVGMGGIGKTTLARKLYNHGAAADQFERRGWVCVSSEFRLQEVIKVLIPQLLDFTLLTQDQLKVVLKGLEQLDEVSLQDLLYQSLQGRRYFVVLDDVWEDADWASLIAAFPDEDTASRLLITSRNRHIAIAKDAQYVFDMKALDHSKSWELFLKTTFFQNVNKRCPKHLERIGREILKKCNGIPLAIKEVGMQLAIKGQSKSEWEMVLKTFNLRVMTAALELSYHKLPPKLKLCFLLLGFFKEGAVIRAEKLVQIWIAGGMILHIGRTNDAMEKTARSYLNRLIDRNMVHIKDSTKDDRVKTCHINNILHRIAITKAKAKEAQRKDSSRPFQGPLHCAVNCTRKRFSYTTNQAKHVDSLFFHGGGNLNDSPFYWKSYKLLRVLDLADFGLKRIPDTIGTLVRLRYLGLRNNHLQELPRTLGRLINLEVLDIALNFMVEVPDVIWKMESLHHLYMSDISCKTPLKVQMLKNLQTLTYISVDDWTYELTALQTLTSLRKLGIKELDGSSDVCRLFTSLAKLENLASLSLRGFRFRSMPPMDELGNLHHVTQLRLDGVLTKFPSVDNFPTNLSHLTLVNASLDEDPSPVLEKLPKLSYLKLRNAYTGEEMTTSHGGFPKLEVLCIGELWHLRNVRVGRDAMPMLKRLEINSCPYLESLPEEVRLMSNLQFFKMATTPSIASKLRDSHIICGIPCVDMQC